MAVKRLELTCAWCGATFIGDKRHKYCSEECAHEAHLEQARANFKRRYETHREQECARQRKFYREHPEKSKAMKAAWEQNRSEYRRKYKRDWYLAHKEATA